MRHTRAEFIVNLFVALKEVLSELIEHAEVRTIIEDIIKFLRGETEFDLNRQYIKMKYLFRGFAIKAWKGSNLNSAKYTECNRILIQDCVKYCKEYWDDRNKKMQDEVVQRERVILWCNNKKRIAIQSEKICQREKCEYRNKHNRA